MLNHKTTGASTTIKARSLWIRKQALDDRLDHSKPLSIHRDGRQAFVSIPIAASDFSKANERSRFHQNRENHSQYRTEYEQSTSCLNFLPSCWEDMHVLHMTLLPNHGASREKYPPV
jgi:hypothetical protein